MASALTCGSQGESDCGGLGCGQTYLADSVDRGCRDAGISEDDGPEQLVVAVALGDRCRTLRITWTPTGGRTPRCCGSDEVPAPAGPARSGLAVSVDSEVCPCASEPCLWCAPKGWPRNPKAQGRASMILSGVDPDRVRLPVLPATRSATDPRRPAVRSRVPVGTGRSRSWARYHSRPRRRRRPRHGRAAP